MGDAVWLVSYDAFEGNDSMVLALVKGGGLWRVPYDVLEGCDFVAFPNPHALGTRFEKSTAVAHLPASCLLSLLS